MHLPRQFQTALLAAAICVLAGTAAQASSTAPLRLRADLLPVSCDVSISNNGNVDFGVIYARNLSQTGFTNSGTKTFNLTLQCDAAAKVAVTAQDGRQGSVAPGVARFLFNNQTDAAAFGVGSVDGRPVGAYLLYREDAATADSATVRSLVSNDGGNTWVVSSNANNAIVPNTRMHSWGAASGDVTPGAYTNITQRYKIRLGLNRKDDLPDLTQDIPIDGLVTFTVSYL